MQPSAHCKIKKGRLPRMIPISNLSHDPYFNLALEEYVVRHLDPSHNYLILWQNSPAVIIGRYQNTAEEVHQLYIEDHGIAVVRRLSGGGAVYHDLGNLNFSLVVSTKGQGFNDFRSFTLPVIETLAHYGVTAELSSRNDITIAGQKFSGNAQYRTSTHLLHHGTILFDSELDAVAQVLNVRQDKIASKGIKSVRSRVTNIKPYLPPDVTLAQFSGTLAAIIGDHNQGLEPPYPWNAEDQAAVQNLVESRYATWDWNWGKSPAFNLTAHEKFPGGSVDVRLLVEEGIIRSCRIYGDFLGQRDIHEFEGALIGRRYQISEVAPVLHTLPTGEYFGAISEQEVLQVLFDTSPSL